MDRRTIWAILLMMAIAVAPAIFMKKPAAPAPRGAAGQRGSVPVPPADTSAITRAPLGQATDSTRVVARDSGPAQPTAPLPRGPAAAAGEDTVRATSPLYTYGVSTRGARLIEATLPRYRSMAPGDRGSTAQILSENSKLLGLTMVLGRDTIPLENWAFTASAERLAVAGPTPLRMRAARNGVDLELT